MGQPSFATYFHLPWKMEINPAVFAQSRSKSAFHADVTWTFLLTHYANT